jgi:hypothetical protein
VRGIVALVLALALALVTRAAFAQDDPGALFAAGAKALREGKASDAIAAFEALADRGTVDAVASYDRGLAYSMRVRVGGEVQGDLGRAAQGFEEARDLTRNQKLADDASSALTIVRSEVARRRTQAGEPVEVDPGRSLARTAAGLLGEDTWAGASVALSMSCAVGLFLRRAVRGRRARVAGGVVAGLAAPALLISIAMTLSARHDRESLREAVVVSAGARPADERGVTTPGAFPLPEGARVELLESRSGWSRFRFGTSEGWIPTGSLRELER